MTASERTSRRPVALFVLCLALLPALLLVEASFPAEAAGRLSKKKEPPASAEKVRPGKGPNEQLAPREQARRLVAEGKLKEAAEILEQVRGREGDSVELLEELAKLYRWQGRADAVLKTQIARSLLPPPSREADEEIVILAVEADRLEPAVEAYRRMISCAPDDEALRDRYLDLLLWKRLHALAEEEIRERLGRTPSPALRGRLVQILADSGRQGQIVGEYLGWIDRAPGDRELLDEASDALVALGFVKDAIPVNRRLAALEPENPVRRARVIRYSLWTGTTEQALPEMLWFADHEPRGADEAQLLAQAHAALRRVEETVRWAGKAVDLEPGNLAYREFFAQALLWGNRPYDALRQYLEILRSDPRHYRAHFMVGDVLYWENRRGVALDHFRQALAILRSLPAEEAGTKENSLLLVRTLVRLGYNPEAVAEARKLVRRFPDDREALLRLAEVYYWTEWHESAILILRSLAIRHPGDREIERFLAACLVRNNEHAEAGPIYDRLLLSNPDDKGLLLDQTAVRVAAGRGDLAIPLHRRVLELDPDKREAALGIGHLAPLSSDAGTLAIRHEETDTSLRITSFKLAYSLPLPPAFTLGASREWLWVKRDRLPYAEEIDYDWILNTFSGSYEVQPSWKVEGSVGIYEGPAHLNPAWSGRLTFRPLAENSLSIGYWHHLLWYDPETYIADEGYRNRWEGEVSWAVGNPVTLSAMVVTEEIFLPEREAERYGRGKEARVQALLHLSRAPRVDVWYRFRYFGFDYEEAYARDVDIVFHDLELAHSVSALYEYNRLDALRFQLQQTFSYDTENDEWGSASGFSGVYSPSGKDRIELGAVYLVSQEGFTPSEWRWITTLSYRRAF